MQVLNQKGEKQKICKVRETDVIVRNLSNSMYFSHEYFLSGNCLTNSRSLSSLILSIS